VSSFALSINFAILSRSTNSFFSNSETCFTLHLIYQDFVYFLFCLNFFTVFSGNGIASGVLLSIFSFLSTETTVFVFVFFTFFGGACSDTNFFSFSFNFFFFFFSIIFFAFGANGIFVFSAICMSSTETIGGISSGFFAKKGQAHCCDKN
jgi:hypothetical protein